MTNYTSNRIKTTRYTWWSFLPVALFIQFTKVVNCFYLANTLLQSFPSISTNDPIYGAIVLTTLILIGMVKEFLADLKRYKTDKESNSMPTQLVTGRFCESSVENGMEMSEINSD